MMILFCLKAYLYVKKKAKKDSLEIQAGYVCTNMYIQKREPYLF
jgi:hypothetical protein